uniref:Immediate early response 3-interacting protein 1 n=1 Tax=Ditylenchus dipsaci TaxID=166011 RepID=A0A915EFX4_9BILA
MFFSLYSLLEFLLLVLNGFAIINRERVLNKFIKQRQHSFSGSEDSSVAYRFVNLVLSIQTVLRVPLIFANSLCYNKGCGQKFDPDSNSKDSCLYHPGPPYFHDAYKIWQCWRAQQREAPDVVKAVSAMQEIRPEKQEDVIVWNGLNKPAARPDDCSKKDLIKLKVEVNEGAMQTILRHQELNAQNGDANEDNLIGACCKITPAERCIATPTVTKPKRKVDKIREDWYSRSGYIHVNIYCRGAIPETSRFESDGLVVRVHLVHGFGDKETQLDYELFGEIIAEESVVVVGERKVELQLKQASVEGWPQLRYDKANS